MKKSDLLNKIDKEMLDKLFGFCYARTRDSYEAEELCSDIVFALIKSANTEGEIESLYPFVWRVARNVYAEFSEKRRQSADRNYLGDPEELLLTLADDEDNEDSKEHLQSIFREIMFLTRAYREVMIAYYIDGLSTKQIASLQGTSETAIRQRLFSARQLIRDEVTKMDSRTEIKKPVCLTDIDLVIWGTGTPSAGDPRNVAYRQFSKHVIWLCRNKAVSADEIAEKLNVPTSYVEEELEIQTRGESGSYGMLKRLDRGRYTTNIVLLDRDEINRAQNIYKEKIPVICNRVAEYIGKNKDRLLSFPYLNHKVDLNLILWQQIRFMADALSGSVKKMLEKEYFADVKKYDRPFSVYGFLDNGAHYGGGWDGTAAHNLCGYKLLNFENYYFARIKKHFYACHNVSLDHQLQMAVRAMYGLDINTLDESEKETAAKAVECGYIYCEGDKLYTKILFAEAEKRDAMLSQCDDIAECFKSEAEEVARKIAAMIRECVPEHIMSDYTLFNSLANMPVLDTLVENMVDKGILILPENGVGAEGCWFTFVK